MRAVKTGTMVTLAALSLLAITAAPASAKHSSTVRQKQSLESTGIDDDAFGLAKLQVKNGSDGTFELQVKRLARNTSYQVLVNGVLVGSITTTGGGNGKIRFRSRPRAKDDQLLGFDPRGAEIIVEAEDGSVVLRVTLSDTPPASGDVVCCVPDDSGAECEDRTADECAAQGGTVSTATSCLPNPCADVPPPPGTDVFCCIPDDSGPECEDRTTAECAAEGGVTVTATSCDPNPCAPATPPTDPDIQCCIPDNTGFECEDRTPAECAAQGGTDMGAGTCTPDPCASLAPGTGGTTPGDDNGGGTGSGSGSSGRGGHDDGSSHT